MENLKMTELPKTFNGHVLTVPEQAWNKLLNYINTVTDAINILNKNIKDLEFNLSSLTNNFEQSLKITQEQLDSTQKNLGIIAEVLEDLVQND